MTTEIIELGAYHESARVAYAYQAGFSCETIEISETDPGGGTSKLNPGQDMEYLQLIFNNKTVDSSANKKALVIAKQLMKMYCAGSCAEIFFQNKLQVPGETEMEIPSQDIKYIELIQAFLNHNLPAHPADYPAHVIQEIFGELKVENNWKMIEILAQRILQTEEKKLTRFQVEDALMKGGIKPRARSQSGQAPVEMQVREDTTKTKSPAEAISSHAKFTETNMLDVVLKDFLGKIKKDWTPQDLTGAIVYLKEAFKKFGQ